jgi:predicted transcriptional regulator
MYPPVYAMNHLTHIIVMDTVTTLCDNQIMNAATLDAWMKRYGWTVKDVATELQIHFNTVYRFLKGQAVHRSTEAAIERLVNTRPPSARAAS